MTAGEIPKTYDRILQRLAREQDASAIIPPFLYPHSIALRAFKSYFSPMAWREEFYRGLRRSQPNSLRMAFSGVEGVLDELAAFSTSDLKALQLCHLANRRRIERVLRIRFWSTLSAAIVGISGIAGSVTKLGIDLSLFEHTEIQTALASAGLGVLLGILLIFYVSIPIVGRLDVLSDLFAITLEKEADQPPQRNADSRPSSGDSPAAETPASLGPRG